MTYIPSTFLIGDPEYPMTDKQIKFYQKRGWSINNVTKKMAFRQIHNWLEERIKSDKSFIFSSPLNS